LGDFLPVYIVTCWKDPLRDDGTVLEVMFKEKGFKVKRDHYEGVPHYFWIVLGMEGSVEFSEERDKRLSVGFEE
jgi:versiconal hemiacetal acetate esterase